MFWPFTDWINCSSDLKRFLSSWPSASNFKSFFLISRTIFLTVAQNNFGNKIPFLLWNSRFQKVVSQKLIKMWFFTSNCRFLWSSILVFKNIALLLAECTFSHLRNWFRICNAKTANAVLLFSSLRCMDRICLSHL